MGSNFYTRYEVARLLNIPASRVDDLELHACPQGYHRDVVFEFCQTHGLPADRPVGVVAYLSLGKDPPEGVKAYETWEGTLLAVDDSTRVIIIEGGVSDTRVAKLRSFAEEEFPRLFLVGVDTSCVHREAKTLQEAKRLADHLCALTPDESPE